MEITKKKNVWIVSDHETVPRLADRAAHNNGKGFELRYFSELEKVVKSLSEVKLGKEKKPDLMVIDLKNEGDHRAKEMLRLANDARIEATPMKGLLKDSLYVDISRHNFSDKTTSQQISM